MHKYVKVCPNLAGLLRLRQDILGLLNQKVQADAQKAALNETIQAHHKAHNPSGVHFNGEAKRPAPQTDDGNDAKDANTYASEPDGPKSTVEDQAERIIAGQRSIHDLMMMASSGSMPSRIVSSLPPSPSVSSGASTCVGRRTRYHQAQ